MNSLSAQLSKTAAQILNLLNLKTCCFLRLQYRFAYLQEVLMWFLMEVMLLYLIILCIWYYPDIHYV